MGRHFRLHSVHFKRKADFCLMVKYDLNSLLFYLPKKFIFLKATIKISVRNLAHYPLCLYLTRRDTCQGNWEVPHLPATLRLPNTRLGRYCQGQHVSVMARSSFDLRLHPGLFYAGQGARVTVKWLDCLRPIVLRLLWIRMQIFS